MLKEFIRLGDKKVYFLYTIDEFEYIPIVFVCCDDSNNLYLCLCSEIRKKAHWTIVSCVQSTTILNMCKGKIPMYDAFKTDKKVYSVEYTDEKSGMKYKEVDFAEIDPTDLPDEGYYFDTDDETIKELEVALNNNCAKNYRNYTIDAGYCGQLLSYLIQNERKYDGYSTDIYPKNKNDMKQTYVCLENLLNEKGKCTLRAPVNKVTNKKV